MVRRSPLTSPSLDSSSRRAVLGALGATALGSLAGCSAPLSALRPTHHRERDAPLGDADGWPTIAADARNTSADVDGAPIPADAAVEPIGRMDVGGFRAPAVADGTVVYGEKRHPAVASEASFRTVAYDVERGEAAWSADVLPAHGTPTIVGDTVFVSQDATYALDRRTGEVCWRYDAGSVAEWVSPAVVDETLYVPDSKRGVFALDAVTGELAWKSGGPGSVDFGYPQGIAAGENQVFVTTGNADDGTLFAFDRDGGDSAWTTDVVGESYTLPVVGDDRVFAVGTAGELHALTLDGDPAWSVDLGGESYVPPAYADGTVYVTGSNNAYLSALDAGDGTERWRYDDYFCYAPPTVVGDVVYTGQWSPFGTGVGYALDRASGELRHTHELGVRVETPLAVVDGRAYFGGQADDNRGYRGTVFALG